MVGHPRCKVNRNWRERRQKARVIATKPRNWRERRQKARVIAASYRRRKPEPVWDEAF